MESVGGSATSKSLFGEEVVLPVAPTPPVVDVLLKNTIFKTRRRRSRGVQIRL